MKAESVKTSEGVTEPMGEMWLRCEAGIPQRKNNVFFVELPHPTGDELAAAREDDRKNNNENCPTCTVKCVRFCVTLR